jgi:hypothetical protein
MNYGNVMGGGLGGYSRGGFGGGQMGGQNQGQFMSPMGGFQQQQSAYEGRPASENNGGFSSTNTFPDPHIVRQQQSAYEGRPAPENNGGFGGGQMGGQNQQMNYGNVMGGGLGGLFQGLASRGFFR